MARKVQLQTNGKEWQTIDGVQVLVDVERQDIDPITSSSCVQIEGFRTLEEAVSDNNMLSQDLTYTKVMDKVGGDYHQNVLDGQYSKAILYGNTQVNLCEEDSSNSLQIPTTFTSFNNGELQINNKENQVVAPLVKGVTMVNLAQERSATFDTSNSYVVENVKGNTTYTVFFNFTVKNTNAGIIIQSYNGNTYLENSMHKTQLGDKVKFTFTTHSDANRFSICNPVAYGGETIQLDDIMVIEGDQTALDIPFFKGMRSVELVKPLTNLFTNDLQHYDANVTSTNNNGTVTVTATSNNSWANVHYNLANLKAHTNYLVMWDSVSTTQTSTTNTDILICMTQISNNENLGRMDNNSLNPTKRCIMFNTGDIPLTDIILRVHATLNNTETGTTTVTGLRVFEYDDYLRSVDLQSIGWFGGTKNVAVEPIKTCNKNLYPYGHINFTPTSAQAWFDAKGNGSMTGDIALKSQTRFLLKKGTYTITLSSTTNGGIQVVGDKEEIITGGISGIGCTTFTLERDTYCTVRFKSIEANVSCTATNIQIERGATATDYVAHDSRYYEPNGQNTIVLRSLPSGVCDTFNLQTGEYVQRIGEVVFDGTENQSDWQYTTDNGTFRIEVDNASTIPSASYRNKLLVLSDKLNAIKYNDNWNSGTFVSLALNRKIVFRIDGITNVTDFVNYLSQNPITVQYELENPITTIIPRTIKRNNNGTVSTADFGTYTNKENLRLPSNPSYLTINGMTSIKPVVEPITYIDFKTRLKTNTDYSIIMDKDNTNKTINLGGTSQTYTDKMLVRTPSINLEQNLRISGNGSIQNIMVIEDDVLNKELPYFNGMCNVKMPIVRNCGKNLFNMNDVREADVWKSDMQIGSDKIYNVCKREVGGGFGAKVRVKLKPNTQYYIGWEGQNSVYVYIYWNSDIWGTQGSIIVNRNTTFTTPGYVKYATIGLNYLSNGCAINTFISTVNPILVEVGNDTSYEPYRGNDICIVEDNIALRSLPNGVKDELNLLTGEYIQRVGEVILDGSEEWFSGGWSNQTTTIGFEMHLSEGITSQGDFQCISDKFDYGACSLFDIDKEYINAFNWMLGYRLIRIRILRSRLVTEDVNGFKEWLQSNPITVQYELEQPIISYPRIVSNTQEREVGIKLPNGVCDTYNPSTGVTVKRVGKMILDGSENWKNANNYTNTYRFKLTIPDAQPRTGIVCHDMYVRKHDEAHGEYEYIINFDDAFYLNLLKTKLSTLDVAGVKTYLASNPITVWYELKNPIVTTDIVLPNGVHDEYNPLTGLYTKRVGYVELDGSDDENWIWGAPATGTDVNTKLFLSPCPQAQIIPLEENCNIICDKLPFVYGLWDTDREGIHVFSNTTHIAIRVATSKLTEATLVGLKQYLSQNPIKVWYELATPQKIQLTPYFGLSMPYAYKDGYLIMDSAYEGQTLPPEITYQLTVNRTGQITQNNIKLKEHTARLSNLEYILIEATLESIFSREMQNFELELMNVELFNLDE